MSSDIDTVSRAPVVALNQLKREALEYLYRSDWASKYGKDDAKVIDKPPKNVCIFVACQSDFLFSSFLFY
jgi:hypothetical protein